MLLLVSDADWVKACTALGQVRLDIARKHGLIDPDKFNFLWVVDFPLFEYSEEEGRYMAMHHPFTPAQGRGPGQGGERPPVPATPWPTTLF